MTPQERRSRVRKRKDSQQRNKVLLAVALAALGVLLFSGWRLFSYLDDLRHSHSLDDELRALYYQTEAPETAAPGETPSKAPTRTPRPLYATATPVPPESATFAPQPYPDNPTRKTDTAINRLQRNITRDIVGWLSIDGLLDQAVVQRDNDYYLRRDYKGYHNQNGSIFLDEAIGLYSRPYTITLYGHNMKSGAMFGCLRQFENLSYYKRSPFLSFSSLYEQGRYVIFAVSQVTTVQGEKHFIAFNALPFATLSERRAIISDILRVSILTTPIDVQPDDQLLLMVTCSGDETERRLVCARRLREDETEASLLQTIQRTTKKAE